MKSRFGFLLGAAASALILLGGVCGRKLYPPEFVEVPYSVYAGETARVRLVTSGHGYDSVHYVVNWDDGTVDTTAALGLTDTATAAHVWTDTGTMQVRVAVYSPDDPQGIRWGDQRAVSVEAGGEHAPVIDAAFIPSLVGVKGAATPFTVRAHDPDDDSLRLEFSWDATETTTTSFASPCSATVSHVFTQVGTAVVVVSARDVRGALSLPDTIVVPVGTAGGVKWWWQSYSSGGLSTSPVVLNDGHQVSIYAGCPEDFKLYAIDVSSGKVKATATTRYRGYIFTGEAAFCEATRHIIVGSDEGELYAFNLNLSCAWHWPNAPAETLEPFIQFGAPAIRDNRLYVPRADDSLYYLIDSIDHGVRVATFAANAGIVDAPVIDAQGNVYFGTDSGYLYKVGPELDTMFWRTRLIAHGEIHGLVVGRDGAIYCGSESSRVYAVDPVTGDLLWTVKTEGRPLRPAMGQSAIFVGTDHGAVYSLDPNTGSTFWQKSLGQGVAFNTTPIVAANDYVYLQNDDDILYTLNQADGTQIWACDCNKYLPSARSPRPRKLGLTDYDPNPTITSNGDILVVGRQAAFCVVGYPEGPLDPLAAWPKWQHDLYNTGYVGGGR